MALDALELGYTPAPVIMAAVSVPQAAPTPAAPEWVRLTVIVDFSGIVDFLSKS